MFMTHYLLLHIIHLRYKALNPEYFEGATEAGLRVKAQAFGLIITCVDQKVMIEARQFFLQMLVIKHIFD
jgi:hypothetical protein